MLLFVTVLYRDGLAFTAAKKPCADLVNVGHGWKPSTYGRLNRNLRRFLHRNLMDGVAVKPLLFFSRRFGARHAPPRQLLSHKVSGYWMYVTSSLCEQDFAPPYPKKTSERVERSREGIKNSRPVSRVSITPTRACQYCPGCIYCPDRFQMSVANKTLA